MRRYAKTFTQTQGDGPIAPYSNKFTVDLMGVEIDDDQLQRIRAEAVRAALTAAAKLLRRDDLFDAFGTFSTFSTFSTFGSGAALEGGPAADIGAQAQRAIDDVVGGKRRAK